MNITVRQIEFKSTNGQNTVFGWIYIPTGSIKAVVQIVHGMAEHMGRYHEFMRWLAQNGYAACGIDHIGHGRSVINEQMYGFFAEQDGWKKLVDDQYKFNKIVRSEIPHQQCILLGHSMGSLVARLYAAKYGPTINGLVIVGTTRAGVRVDMALKLTERSIKKNGPVYRDRIINKLLFGKYNERFQPVKSGSDWLSRDAEAVRLYDEDPKCGFMFTVSAHHDLFMLAGQANGQKCFENVRKDMPILLLSGDMDPVGEYGKGPTMVYNRYIKAGVSDVELMLYEGARHELLNETNRKQVYSDLLGWLDDHFSPEGALSVEDMPEEGET